MGAGHAGYLAVGAVRLVTRAELRTRWRELVGLGLLLGLVGGVVLGSVALAARTATAYGRLVAAVGLDDARVLVPPTRAGVVDALPALPGVARVWAADSWVAQVDGPAVRYVSIVAGPGRPADLVRPVVVAGRPPRDDAADEVLLAEPVAAELGVGPGAELTLRLLRPTEIGRFDTGFGEPDGAVARVRVTGVGRAPTWGGPLNSVVATPAFARAHHADVGARAGFVRLTDTAPPARAAFAAAVARLTATYPEPGDLDDYLRPEPSFPTAQVDPSVLAARSVLVGGLAVFGTVIGLGGLLVVGQGLLRHHGTRTESQRVEAALGLTALERAAARVSAGAVGAAVAGVVGGVLTLGAGVLEPLGSLARFEPAPGWRPPWTVALLGGTGLAVTFAAMTAVAALASAHRHDRPAVRLSRRTVTTRLARRPVLLAGLGLAWRGGGLRTLATVAGLTFTLAGVVAAVAFGASLQRLADTPARYGATFDLSLIDAREPDVEALAADPRVVALDRISSVPVVLGDDTVPHTVVAVEHRKGNLPLEVVSGTPPRERNEIALGPRAAARLGVGAGDFLPVAPPGRTPVAMLVTGTVLVRADTEDVVGEVGLVTSLQLREMTSGTPLVTAAILAAPGQAGPLLAELGSRREVHVTGIPESVRNLADLLSLPELLALVLAAVSGVGIVYTLLNAGRRHRHDLAVLAVLGATPGQLGATLGVAAAATVLPAVAVGVPLGLGLARVLWWETATGVGVGGDLAVPVALLLVIGPVVLLVALLIATVPAVQAARTPPAAVLAGE